MAKISFLQNMVPIKEHILLQIYSWIKNSLASLLAETKTNHNLPDVSCNNAGGDDLGYFSPRTKYTSYETETEKTGREFQHL